MKIMVAAVASSAEMSGVQRHALNAVRCLLLRPEIPEVHLVLGAWQRKLVPPAGLGAETSNRLIVHLAEMDRGSIGRNLWYYRGLPLLAAEQKVDLVHLAYPAPLRSAAFACPTVVTLHDLYPYEIPSNFGWRQAFFHRFLLRQCLRSANAIACVSEITRSRLRHYAPRLEAEKTVRIYNCVEANGERSNGQSCSQTDGAAPIVGWPISAGKDEPFLLCVAQHRRNKNIPLLVRSLARLLRAREIDPRMKLLVVGIEGPETPRIRRQIARSGMEANVHLLEGISEAELQWCYARCAALVAPSSTEGFGLPIAEGLLAGCRIVCTDIPAFREIGEGACRFVPLSRRMEAPLAQAIAEALGTAAPMPVELPQFSAPTLAGQYLALYRKLIASASPRAMVAMSAVEERRPR